MTSLTREQQDRWFPRLAHLAGVMVAMSTTVGFYLFAYRPLVLRQLENTARAEQLELLTSHAAAIHTQHTQLRQELATLTSTVDAVRSRIPEEPLDAEFVRDVRRLATEAGVEVRDHRLAPPQRLGTHSQSEVHCDCLGRYDSICRFLDQVEQIPRIVKVAKLELGTSDNSDVYPLQVTFVLYYGLPANDTNERRDGLSRN
jgi:Tfp pilus assembly protein PilO